MVVVMVAVVIREETAVVIVETQMIRDPEDVIIIIRKITYLHTVKEVWKSRMGTSYEKQHFDWFL